jgi:hypothetical protein
MGDIIMLPVLPLYQTYFSFDEVCQWVDVAPAALKYWLSSQGTQPYDTHTVKASLPIERRYHRREVIWLCKAKPAIEEMARSLLPKQEDPYAYIRKELGALLETLKAAGVANIRYIAPTSVAPTVTNMPPVVEAILPTFYTDNHNANLAQQNFEQPANSSFSESFYSEPYQAQPYQTPIQTPYF